MTQATRTFLRFQDPDGTVHYGELTGPDEIRIMDGPPVGKFKVLRDRRKFEEIKLLAPVDPLDIVAIGLNYRTHADESGMAHPDAPVIFLKASSSVLAPDEPIVLPHMTPSEVDYEAELAVIIGRTAKNVDESEALKYVLGYTCGNDVSARDAQLRLDKQWARGKSCDTFCPLGPCLVTGLDPDALRVRSRLNGEVMQDGNTRDLIFSVPRLVSYISHNKTLRPGDVIMTGTPGGVGFARTPQVFLKEGDVVEIEVEGIGVLRNPVVSEKIQTPNP